MDPLTAGVFTIVVAGACLYVLYWVIRKAVAAGIRDAADDSPRSGGSDPV